MSLKDRTSLKTEPEIVEPDTTAKTAGWFDGIVLLLCLIGVGIAGYLSYTHVFNKPIICSTGGGCDVVNSSQYAYFLGLPVAVMGLAAYLTLAVLVIARWLVSRQGNVTWRGRLDWLLFLFSLSSVIFSGYLVAMSLFVIKATCIWCLGSATTISLLFVLLSVRLWRSIGTTY